MSWTLQRYAMNWGDAVGAAGDAERVVSLDAKVTQIGIKLKSTPINTADAAQTTWVMKWNTFVVDWKVFLATVSSGEHPGKLDGFEARYSALVAEGNSNGVLSGQPVKAPAPAAKPPPPPPPQAAPVALPTAPAPVATVSRGGLNSKSLLVGLLVAGGTALVLSKVLR